MAIARFKDLCLDVTEPTDRMGRFWAVATGLRFEPDDGAGTLVADGDPAQKIWLNLVPEPRTGKNRVHLDVHCASVQELLDAGATVAEDYPGPPTVGWQVLRDPEGGELCAFVRPPERLSDYRVYELGVDCADAETLAAWWADVLGGTVGRDEEHGYVWVEGAPGLPFESIVFNDVPEPKTVRNRIHWDVTIDAPGRVDELEARGAVRLPGYPTDRWTVMADPEGNEFCVFVD